MVTVIVIALVCGILIHLAMQDWESTILCTFFGLIVGFVLAGIIGACLPEISIKESTRQMEVLNVGNDGREYYLEAIDAYKTTDYYIYQFDGKLYTVSHGTRKIEYRDIAKPYVELGRTEVDLNKVPKWSLLFGFGNMFHQDSYVIFYVPEKAVYVVP